jgi:hypothetical protein
MSKVKRLIAIVSIAGTMASIAPAVAHADAPGPGSKPQCAGGKFPGANGNPHCPQN